MPHLRYYVTFRVQFTVYDTVRRTRQCRTHYVTVESPSPKLTDYMRDVARRSGRMWFESDPNVEIIGQGQATVIPGGRVVEFGDVPTVKALIERREAMTWERTDA